ncbi:MAG: peptidoglycan-binding protein LysM [Pasteurellaceae bacterium]|nr:peptidoglycan-binding protein LysM [Pasteurellaceae bacterium]
MGLFDFVGDIGKKIFSKKEEASEAVTNHIAEDNPGVENVQVTVDDDGVAKLEGAAASASALEKAILMAGNIAGIRSVNVDSVTVANGETVASDDEFYVIQKGDTLWKIAEKTYGNGAKYTAIVDANKEVIKDADKIFPGQKIRLPKSL